MIVLEVVGQALFWLVMVAAVLMILVGLPGTFVIVVNSLIYGVITSFDRVTGGLVALLFGIAVLAELAEFYIGAAAAGKYGASRQGMVGAILGGFAGAIWMTPFLPVIGTLAGAFAGAFAGATLLEYLQTRDWDLALRVGRGAFLGSIGGKLTKIAAATAMVVLVAARVF